MKILIVEDEKALSKVLKEKFESAKFTVKTVDNGNEVLRATKSMKPDMILLDIILPGKQGLDVLEELKADNNLNTIPVIMISNIDSDNDIKKALSLGAVDYFVKSQHPLKEIVDKVQEQIKKPVTKRATK